MDEVNYNANIEAINMIGKAQAQPSQVRSDTGSVVIRNVSKSYTINGKALSVLENINLTIRPGEFVSIVGASGCGKSTLLRLIAGLDVEYQGEILQDGQRITGTSLNRGIVFQDHRLFPWLTVEQNVLLALSHTHLNNQRKKQLVSQYIALVGLQGFETAYPHQLSGGMAQRAAIARSLVNEPEILLLDEPLGALDALTRVHLQKELRRIWQEQGITMVMVTHDVDEAVYLGDRVVVMESRPGRIKSFLPVQIAHPREKTDFAFARLTKEVVAQLSGETSPAELQVNDSALKPIGQYQWAW